MPTTRKSPLQRRVVHQGMTCEIVATHCWWKKSPTFNQVNHLSDLIIFNHNFYSVYSKIESSLFSCPNVFEKRVAESLSGYSHITFSSGSDLVLSPIKYNTQPKKATLAKKPASSVFKKGIIYSLAYVILRLISIFICAKDFFSTNFSFLGAYFSRVNGLLFLLILI